MAPQYIIMSADKFLYKGRYMDIKSFFQQYPEVAVAVSGGVDSAVLLALACEHAKRVKAYYIKTQFQPAFELNDAQKIAEHLNVDLSVTELDVLSDSQIAANPQNRCYYCKKRIFSAICSAAEADGFCTVLDGTNASDDADDRPGMRALGELKIHSPLRLCGYTKADVRKIALNKGLFVADKPSYACLATRIPHGTIITSELLILTENAENELRAMGFKNFRVRYSDGAAKLEFSKDDLSLFNDKKEEATNSLSRYYREVLPDIKERPNDD